MRTLRDFYCEHCGIEQERYVDGDTKVVPCQCGHDAIRLIGMPRVALDGTDAGFPGAYSKWADLREQNARIKSKRSYHGE
jgi:hypothetical protein